MRETAGTSAVHDHSAADDETVARDDPPANEADEVEDEAGDEVAEERDPDQQSESGEAGWQAEGLAVQKDGNGDAEGAQSGDDAAEPGSSKSTTTPHTRSPAPQGKRNRALKQSVSNEAEPPTKASKLLGETSSEWPGVTVPEAVAAAATGLALPQATGHGQSPKPTTPALMGGAGAAVLQATCDEEANSETTLRERGSVPKRGRVLGQHPSAEDAPQKGHAASERGTFSVFPRGKAATC